MLRWITAVLCVLSAGMSSAANTPAAQRYENNLDTMWEVLWHQSGAPTRLVRWEQDIRVRLQGVDLASHREFILGALGAIAAESGVRVLDVSNLPDAASQANVDIRISSNEALQDNQPCVTMLDYKAETRIESATIEMRTGDVKRCAYHELMHVMGLRGHPAGPTVLSYFQVKVDSLLPLDRTMLRAWYSGRARGGMTPFEVLPVLAEELARPLANQAEAQRTRERFYARTVQQMHAFVEGRGEAPAILKRSGKTTAEGLRFGRTEMGYFLGVAYLEGTCVVADTGVSAQWLQRAATMGNRAALARLSAGAK